MGRGSDDSSLTLERPVPLRVASTEGLDTVLKVKLLCSEVWVEGRA